MQKSKDSKLINFTGRGLLLLAFSILVFCFYNLNFEIFDINLLLLTLIAVAAGSFLQIQLPRTKIHISITDGAVFYAFLVYNIEIAILLSATEAIFSSFYLRKKGLVLKNETVLFNFSASIITTFLTGMTTLLLFREQLTNHLFGSVQTLILILTVIAAAQFLFNSMFVSVITSLKQNIKVKQVFLKNCVNTLILFVIGALVAGLMYQAIKEFDALLVFATIVIAMVAHFTYKRYVNDVVETAAQVEQSERRRAEQAENHVLELQHYISELESSANALRESEKKLRYTAFHDSLTDLPNRNKFLERLQFLIEKSKYNPKMKFAVIYINLNRFKTINDSLGYATGNYLLKNVGKRLKNSYDKDGLAARFGSDEFAIILNEIENVEEAIHYAEKIHRKISEPYTLEGNHVFISPSIGIGMNAPHYTNSEDLLRDSNIAMYYAKESEKSYIVFDQKMHIQAVNRLQLETDLRYAVERNELLVYYQPILDLDSIELIGFEALMRWQHPQRGIVPPDDFIPVSEATGLIVPMSLWILRESCSRVVEWQKKYEGKENLIISVNLSGKHFAHPDLVEQVQKIIIETGINVKCLKLEITESAVMENAESAIRMLKQLREIGVQLSIDDFGTGYSSLSYLHRFPINTLKIDRSFVMTMEAGSENGEIVRTIIALAKTLNLSVIAEGIESIHQIHQLRVLGCEFGQGYLFSRPVPVDEAERLLMDSHRWQSILPKHRSGIVRHKTDFPILELDEGLPDKREIIQ